ncbi:M67 family metallopeptidase [Altererythrobacter sp. ZODW24]|uniref:Mov34/MPN/PAD-1 family protein n=1 Tax=Altererythrobacter sp. ZODW24 TaxID=2185142 RepID=UPI000DF7A1EC|nr:M67 family metallopeptidase [Altererythrobacter sp. ZODW24]
MRLVVTREVLDLIEEAARAAHPLECCGILFGEGGSITAAIPANNVHPDPATHFEVDAQALIDAHRAERNGGPKIAGYYHSHPNGLARPSATDIASAAHDGKIWAIIVDGAVNFWRDDAECFTALSYSVADG